MIGLWPFAPDYETGSRAAARARRRFPAGSSMMRGGSRQSGRLIFDDCVPVQRTVPDAAASNPRLCQAVEDRARFRNRVHKLVDRAGLRMGGVLSDITVFASHE